MRCSLLASLAVSLAACGVDVSAGRVERCLLGAHADPTGTGLSAEMATTALETTIGRHLDIDRTYHVWTESFPDGYDRWSADQGHTMLMSFHGDSAATYSWARVADPNDATIAAERPAMAGRVRDYGHPIYLVYHDEADNDGAFGTADEFVAAWKRVVGDFRAAGATNAIWVWSLSSASYPSLADAWYPGDEWVDWIGATGFNWYNGDPSSSWRTFSGVFASFLEWSAPHPRPLMIVSTSSAENPTVAVDAAKSKQTWIRETLTTLDETPAIQAVVWFNGQGPDAFHDWRVDSSPGALAAFRDLATAPHLDATAQTPP